MSGQEYLVKKVDSRGMIINRDNRGRVGSRNDEESESVRSLNASSFIILKINFCLGNNVVPLGRRELKKPTSSSLTSVDLLHFSK